jgi:hypothetical protein
MEVRLINLLFLFLKNIPKIDRSVLFNRLKLLWPLHTFHKLLLIFEIDTMLEYPGVKNMLQIMFPQVFAT